MRSPKLSPTGKHRPVTTWTALRIRKPSKSKKQRGLHASLLALVETFPVKHLYQNKMRQVRATVTDSADSSIPATPW